MTWIWIIIAVLYILSPYDLLPDFIPIRGWIDDGIVIVLLYRYIARLLARRRFMASQGGAEFGKEQTQQQADKGAKTPFEVLGVSPDATREQIQKAYRKLANQYHPDKVAHLGHEFQSLAEERFKEIQEAYQQVTRP